MDKIENMDYLHFIYCVANNILPIVEIKPLPKILRTHTCTFQNTDSKLYSFYFNRHYLQYYTLSQCMEKFLIDRITEDDYSDIASEALSRTTSLGSEYTEEDDITNNSIFSSSSKCTIDSQMMSLNDSISNVHVFQESFLHSNTPIAYLNLYDYHKINSPENSPRTKTVVN